MLSKKKLLPIDELKPGMISSMDITIENKVLLSKGVAITDSIIKSLKETYIFNKVEVYLENDSSEVFMMNIKTIKELQNTFNEFSSNLENIFNNLSNIKNPKMDEMNLFVKEIKKEFNETGIVIKNIVAYGSGSDTIYRHSVNVAAISFILGKWLGLNEDDLNILTYSAILHDFGKLEIDKNILNNPFSLTPEEYETFKTHPVIGYHFVKQIPNLNKEIGLAILMHHEKMDGSGYPLGVRENKISRFAKIISIADLFDEVSSNRYFKDKKGPFEALKVIQDESLLKLNCTYCNMFLNHIINYYTGEKVLLNDNRICKIIQIDINNLTKPLLLDDNGFLDLKSEKDLYVQNLIV